MDDVFEQNPSALDLVFRFSTQILEHGTPKGDRLTRDQ